jgi:hypothetical protein
MAVVPQTLDVDILDSNASALMPVMGFPIQRSNHGVASLLWLGLGECSATSSNDTMRMYA